MKNIYFLSFFIFSLCFSTHTFGQLTKKQKATKSYLFGNYIPKDVEDACQYLDKLISDDAKSKFVMLSEDDAAKKLFFGFGKWLRVNWNLDDISRYTVYLNTKGVSYPDDIVFLTMKAYHRHLSKVDINAGQLYEEYILKRQELIKQKKERDIKNQTTRIIKK